MKYECSINLLQKLETAVPNIFLSNYIYAQ